MAVKLTTARNTFLQAVSEFPRWMSIRKRPEKATSGLFLQAVIDEQTDIVEELNKFIKEFFLISYVGKESTIASYVDIIQTGVFDYTNAAMIKPAVDITIDPKTFLADMDSYALYQDGYLIISVNNEPSDNTLLYTVDGYRYGGKLSRYHIWNIFDEFAMFLGLERFADTNETNEQLLKRCFLVFGNPTNSTRRGLQNTIINCLSNDITVDREDIKVEILDDNNAWLPYNDSTVYEYFVRINRDILRTKVWDLCWWEHNFAQLSYLSNKWDAHLDVYQDGTGQRDDLKISLSQGQGATTNVTVRGFKHSEIKVNSYCRKQDLRSAIPLSLIRYHNIVNPRHVRYTITATPAVQINTEDIFITEIIKKEGFSTVYLQDIVSSQGYATVINSGLVEGSKSYYLIFRSNGDYSSMKINKIDFYDGNDTVSLISPTALFKKDGNGLSHVDVVKHTNTISELKSSTNLVDINGGFTLQSSRTEGSFTLDVTGCGGKTLRIMSEGRMFDLTNQTDRWQLSGLKLVDGYLISDTVLEDNGSATLTVSVMSYSVKLISTEENQGTCSMKVYVNDILQRTYTQLQANETLQQTFDVMSTVKIVFVKQGSYPFSAEVKGTKYEINYSLTHGVLEPQLFSTVLPSLPDNTPNTLTVTVSAYDVEAPVIRYVHIGPSTNRAVYKTAVVAAKNDSAFFDIDTVCNVSLYDADTNTLISDNFVTKKKYRNKTTEDIYLDINVSQFSEIISSSLPIKKTVQAGKTVSYVTLKPEQEVESVTINGIVNSELGKYSLDTLLDINVTYNVYVSKGINGFVVRNPTTGEEWLTRIDRKSFSDTATTFVYNALPVGITGVFVTDIANNTSMISNYSDKNFDCTFLQTTDDQIFIAHNELDIYKNITGISEDIEIIDSTFYPALPANVSMVYNVIINQGIDDAFAVTAVFKKTRYDHNHYFCVTAAARSVLQDILWLLDNDGASTTVNEKLSTLEALSGIVLANNTTLFNRVTELLTEGSWCLWKHEICFITDFDFKNKETIAYDVSMISPLFKLSNAIELPKKVVIDTREEDISCFMIKPPSYLAVHYSNEYDGETTDTGYVSDDGFTKLHYSNIKSIVSITINGLPTNSYDILLDEGVIIWNLNDMTSLQDTPIQYQVTYLYKIPESLLYTDLSALYDIIPKSLSAYNAVSLKSTIPTKLEDGDSFVVTFFDTVDYVPAPVCSNPNFIAVYDNGVVTVHKVYDDNVILVNAGYYYDDEQEYYLYNHVYSDIIDRYSNVTLHNVKRLGSLLQTMISSNNRIRRSDFKGRNNEDELCLVKFTDPVIGSKGVSLLNEITAAQSYSTWQGYKMDINFVTGIKDIGLLFTAEDSNSYAITDITHYVNNSIVISAFTARDITLEIYREIKMSDDIARKTVFAEPYGTFVVDGNFQGYRFDDTVDLSYRYYLVVKGTGIVDDIIARPEIRLDDQLQVHIKNIEHLGFDIVEKEEKGMTLSLAFDPVGCTLADLEITNDGTVRIGSNVDYGVTKVFSSHNCYENIIADVVVSRYKETFVTAENKGWIRTPFFYLDNSANAIDIYVKVNSLISGHLKNFDIKLYTADNEQGTDAILIGYVQKTNLACFDGTTVKSYVSAEVSMDPNKVVDVIEMFVRYGELGIVPLVIQDNSNGSVTTKVYDTVITANYRLLRLTGSCSDITKIKFFVRGCKKDNLYLVWTPWYDITLNNQLVATSSHIFDDYRLFQFKIKLLSADVEIKISNFVLEVV